MSNLGRFISRIKKSDKTLYILCGFPYAGKSYVARQILKESDLVFVSIDNIFHARGFDWNNNTLPNENEWQEIFEKSYRQVKEALEAGRSVLYDSTNQTITSRDTLRNIANEHEANRK
jgi:predicted kinase